MALSVNQILPVISAQGVGSATSGVVLQPGTVVNAQVLSVADNLVQIAIADLAIDVISEIPLQVGQTLQLAVSQTADGIRLSTVGQGTGAASAGVLDGLSNAPVSTATSIPATAAASNDPLTPLERAAVSVAAGTAATQQQSLGPLFANLSAAASSNRLPAGLQQAVLQVLAQQTPLDTNLTGGDVQNAFQTSGLLLEASLASGAAAPATDVPDLKAALIVLRQALVTTVATTDSPMSAAAASAVAAKGAPTVISPELVPDISSAELLSPRPPLGPSPGAAPSGPILLTEALLNAEPKAVTTAAVLNLVQEALQSPRGGAGVPTTTVLLPDGSSEETAVHTTTPPPPFRGALPAAQPVAAASLPSDAPLGSMAHRLLEDTDAALARQTLLQVASLPDRTDAPTTQHSDPNTPRWNFEVPFATPQGTAMAQFEISRDGGGGNEVERAKQVWRARFSLDVEPAGPVHALVALSGDRTSVRMWAERPTTAAQLRAGARELSQALSAAELKPGDIVIREGTPPQPAPAKAGHFLDRAL